MGLLEEWGDALVEEGLREAADTFFGTRKALEDDISHFESQIGLLRDKAEELRSWFAGLNCLLGSEDNTRLLFDSLGVTLPDPTLYTHLVCSLQFRRPRSFTRKGLFAKTVWEVYEPLARLVDAYLHGSHYNDPLQPGRVLISVNLDMLRRHCADINARIATVNESNRPSESLAFAKRLDQALVQKEAVTGGGEQTWSLDRDLAFKPLDFDAYGLPVFPELPLDDKAQDVAADVCGRIFGRLREHVDTILDEIFDPANKRMCILDRR